MICAVLSFAWSGTATGVVSDAPLVPSTPAAGDDSKPAVQVSKRTAIVISHDGSTLQTSQGTFSLSGVKVLDLTKGKELPKNRKKLAELMFVGGVLKEVVIRQ